MNEWPNERVVVRMAMRSHFTPRCGCPRAGPASPVFASIAS